MTLFSKWTRRRTLLAAITVLSLVFAVFFGVIIIDGEAYDRWRPAHHLRMVYGAWVRDGSPEPPRADRYVLESASSTTFVDTASHLIDGQPYRGLFGYRSTHRLGTYVITRNGEVIVVDDSGRARLLEIHKTKAAAW